MTENKEVMREPEIAESPEITPNVQPEPEGRSKKKEKKKDKQSSELEDLKRQNAESLDRYLRVMAEFDNFRKRTSREKSAMYDDGVRDALLKFLPVVDNFERAMALVSANLTENDGDNSLVKGFAMILRQLKDQMGALGVTEIEAVGNPFDPALHEAVMMAENTEFEADTVVEELLKGYMHKDKPLRHSMVKVAK